MRMHNKLHSRILDELKKKKQGSKFPGNRRSWMSSLGFQIPNQ
jgi:hypothetical protein